MDSKEPVSKDEVASASAKNKPAVEGGGVPKNPARKLSRSLLKKISIVGVCGSIAGLGIWGIPKVLPGSHQAHHSEASSEKHGPTTHEVSHSPVSSWYTPYVQALTRVQTKVDDIQRLSEENVRLRLENENLRQWSEKDRFDCASKSAHAATDAIGNKLKFETGAAFGRVLESIHYAVPEHLLPNQLYALGVSYLNAKDYEKAAVILTFLTSMEQNDDYRTPVNYLMTGLSWYKLDHYKEAEHYFNRILEMKEGPLTSRYQAQARLWNALASEQMHKTADAQKWLRELIDHHPHAQETAWVNGRFDDVAHEEVAHEEVAHEEGHHTNEKVDEHEDRAPASTENAHHE